MAKAQGLVRREEILAEEKQEQAKSYYDQQIGEATQRFGDRLGFLNEEGQFILSDEAEPEIRAEYERIFDPDRGITAKDLFILAEFDRLIEEAKEEGAQAVQAAPASRPPVASRPAPTRRASFTERQSSSIPGRDNLFKKGDSLDEVVRRAASSAFRGS